LVNIELKNVAVGYGGQPVLSGLNLSARAGRVLGLIGPNGCGKSTLVKALAGQLPATGELRYDGLRQTPRALGYMPQDLQAPMALTVLEVVLLGRLGLLRLRVLPVDLDAVRQVLRQLGIEPLAARYVGELSGGQRQMVFLAQALVADPAVLLLDEPISALDLRHQLEVLERVRAVTRERQLCTVVVLHDLNATARYADDVALLCGGQLACFGTPSEVLTADNLALAFRVDARRFTADDGATAWLPHRALAAQ
jgi:iron complex transport system ATP-binding protein